ncbi:LuxR C-terminal-related transcriptional regulator [Streptomyces sp. NPDC127084]|uniref:ATP-binding protein n=1 Tax=Streptomyces sp. NPDC127084 TaxID=3347133 RepID=UPI0036487EEF
MDDDQQNTLHMRLTGVWPLVGRVCEMDAFDQVLTDSRMTAFFVYGQLGVGKSRLAEECLERAAQSGCDTRRAVATSAAASVPLGAIAHLLPDDVPLNDPVAAFAAVAEFLRARRSHVGRTVLLIDDVQLLDATSAMLLRQLMDANLLFLIGSVRSDEPYSDSVACLTGGDAVHHVDLGELSVSHVQDVLERVLGGPVGSHAVGHFHTMSGGNVLFLRELVTGAARAGTLAHDGELWEVSGPQSASTRRLTDLIRARLNSACVKGRRILDTLALCEPLSLPLLAETGDLATTERLEEAGLITVLRDQRRTTVRLAHPLYGEVLREDMPESRRQQTLLHHIGVLERCGAQRREDALHLATYRLAATGTADAKLLVHAAALAIHAGEYARARSLLQAVPEHMHTVRSRLLMGKSLFETGDFERAEHLLARVQTEAEKEDDVLAAVLLRCQNLMWGVGTSPAQLTEVIEAGRRLVTTGEGHFSLVVYEAACACVVGDYARSLDLCRGLQLDDPRTHDLRTWRIAVTTKSAALSFVGHTREALEWADRAVEAFAAPDEACPLGPQDPLNQAIRALALTEGGRIDEARAVAQRTHTALAGQLTAARFDQRLLSFHVARAEWFAGHPRTSRRWYAQVANASRPYTAVPLSTALAGLTASAALMGDVEAAEKAWAEYRQLGGAVPTPEEMLGRAWLCVARGEISQARTVLMTAAQEARERGHVAFEAILLTDLARLGEARRAAGRLRDIAAATDSPFHRARADFATAWAGEDAERLMAAGERMEVIGADLLAAEAHATAAIILARNGERRPARAAALRAKNLSERCEGARTPALVNVEASAPLSSRELEIGLLAAQGLMSRDIAARLTISVRTVENHLHRIYSKLGVTTRQELTRHLHGSAR